MKLDVKFRHPGGFWKQQLLYSGRGEAHLLETGLVLEGLLPKFTVPFVQTFYYRLLSEWSTRTVPYARIERYRFSGRWIAAGPGRILLLLVLGGLILGASVLLARDLGAVAMAPAVGLTLVLAALLLLYGRRVHHFTYRLPDGRQAVVAFRVAGRRDQEPFRARLREYLDFARTFQQETRREP